MSWGSKSIVKMANGLTDRDKKYIIKGLASALNLCYCSFDHYINAKREDSARLQLKEMKSIHEDLLFYNEQGLDISDLDTDEELEKIRDRESKLEELEE